MLPQYLVFVMCLNTKFEGSRYSYVAVHYQMVTATTACIFFNFVLLEHLASK
jgi:hypothetical protein